MRSLYTAEDLNPPRLFWGSRAPQACNPPIDQQSFTCRSGTTLDFDCEQILCVAVGRSHFMHASSGKASQASIQDLEVPTVCREVCLFESLFWRLHSGFPTIRVPCWCPDPNFLKPLDVPGASSVWSNVEKSTPNVPRSTTMPH